MSWIGSKLAGSPSSSRAPWATSSTPCRCCPPCGALPAAPASPGSSTAPTSRCCRGHPDLTDTLPFDRGAFARRPPRRFDRSRFVRANSAAARFDLVIDLQGLLRTGLMASATGAPRRVGFANAREGSRYAYTDKSSARPREALHAVDRYWRVAEASAPGDLPKRFHVPLAAGGSRRRARELAGAAAAVVAVAVGAKWLTKRWPPAHFAELLSRADVALRRHARVFVGTGDGRDAVTGSGAATASRRRRSTSPARRRCRGSPRCWRWPT